MEIPSPTLTHGRCKEYGASYTLSCAKCAFGPGLALRLVRFSPPAATIAALGLTNASGAVSDERGPLGDPQPPQGSGRAVAEALGRGVGNAHRAYAPRVEALARRTRARPHLSANPTLSTPSASLGAGDDLGRPIHRPDPPQGLRRA